MAINLAEKYSKKIVDKFYVDSVILGKTSKEYDWDGVKSIKVWTITTVDPVDYLRSQALASGSRYGSTTEVEDTVQTMQITQDKAVSLSVDKGNNTQQMLIKNAGIVMARELREKFVPMFDKYCLGVWANPANCGTVTEQGSLTKSNIVEEIGKHATAIRNAGATLDDAYCFIGETNFAKLLLADEFIKYNNPAFGERNLERGVMGKVREIQIVPVPDSYFTDSNVQFLTVKKSCVLAPTQIKDAKVHQDPPGLSGALLEVRWLYDAFVLDTKKNGLAVCLATDASV